MKTENSPENNMKSNELLLIKKRFENAKTIYSKDEIIDVLRECITNYNDAFKNLYFKQLCDEGCFYSYYNDGTTIWFKPYKNKIDFVLNRDSMTEKLLLKFIEGKEIPVLYYNSSFFNGLTSLQVQTEYVIIGIESYAQDYLLDCFRKNNIKAISSSDLFELKRLFKMDFHFDYVTKSINEDTPQNKSKNGSFNYPKIETLLVDVLSDKLLNSTYSSEVNNIFRNALSKYAININTLLRYAKKKGVLEEIHEIFREIGFDKEKGEFL